MPLYYYKCDTEDCDHKEDHLINLDDKKEREKDFICPKCNKQLTQELGFQGFLMRSDRTRDGMK